MATPLFVIKLGGAGAEVAEATRALAAQARELLGSGARLVIVHGGGRQLTQLGERLGLVSRFVNGRRVTDDGLIEAAKMAFAGQVGTDLAAALVSQGVPAVSLSGVDAGLLKVQRRPPQKVWDRERGGESLVDYGWVGDVVGVDPKALLALTGAGLVPLVASLGTDGEGQVYNVNADTVACALAAALGAERLFLLTDVGGVYRRREDPGSLIPELDAAQAEALCADGTATGGMLPKLTAALTALRGGVSVVHVVGWDRGDGLLAALAGRGDGGTAIRRGH